MLTRRGNKGWSEKLLWIEPLFIMKIVKKNAQGETRELLLKEYFLNAYLIALLKRVGEGTGKFRRRSQPEMEPAPVRVK